MAAKRVGIYGSYQYGNFGDDLQAVIIGRRLLANGCTPVFYRLSEDLAKKYGFETVQSIPELVKHAAFCLMGGGGNFRSSYANPSELWIGIDEECFELKNALEEHECNLYSVSVGGDGSGEHTPLRYGRAQLLASERFRGGTVRLPQDVALLNAYGKEAATHPDLLWMTPKEWPAGELPKDARPKIGVNLDLRRGYRRFVKSLMAFSKFWDAELTFIRLHRPEYGLKFAWQPERETGRLRGLTYEEMEPFLQHVFELDLLISSRLHLGLVAMGYGGRFISMGGEAKTRAFLHSIGMEEDILKLKTRRDSITSAWRLLRESRSYERRDYSDEIEKAGGHLAFLDRLCNGDAA